MESAASEELIRRCQEAAPGDTRAFEQLVAIYKDRVFRLAYRVMGNYQEAEDQAQEVFIKVYRNIPTLEDPATFTSWIYRITTNTCLDALARQRRRPSAIPLAPADDAGEPPAYADERIPTPEQAVLQGELRRCLELTLSRLEVRDRATLVLREIEGRSYQEIAEALTIGLSAAKMRIHRARLAFQQLLDRICPDVWHNSRLAEREVAGG